MSCTFVIKTIPIFCLLDTAVWAKPFPETQYITIYCTSQKILDGLHKLAVIKYNSSDNLLDKIKPVNVLIYPKINIPNLVSNDVLSGFNGPIRSVSNEFSKKHSNEFNGEKTSLEYEFANNYINQPQDQNDLNGGEYSNFFSQYGNKNSNGLMQPESFTDGIVIDGGLKEITTVLTKAGYNDHEVYSFNNNDTLPPKSNKRQSLHCNSDEVHVFTMNNAMSYVTKVQQSQARTLM